MAMFYWICIVFMMLKYLAMLSLAEQLNCKPCDKSCQQPNCRCLEKTTPGDLPVEKTPQMVAFTFDDAVHDTIYDTLTELFPEDRKNPDGSPVSVTMFVSDEYTDYCAVRRLWERGHEIASHSVTHRLPISWWGNATKKQWKEEMVGFKETLIKKTNIPSDDIKGTRAPFLQGGGNKMFRMMAEDADFTYDSTLIDAGSQKERYWPYSLDYQHNALGCVIPPCPTSCFKGLWEVPLRPSFDNTSTPCNFLDSCVHQPTNEEQAYYMFQNNFEAAYKSNKAPVLFNIHAVWLRDNEHANAALRRFLDDILKKDDVYVITVNQILEWMKNPTPIDKLRDFKPWKPEKRGMRWCVITRQTHPTPFILSGTSVVVCEFLFLTLLAIYLIARDTQ